MRAILLILAVVGAAFAAPKERDITPLITGATWNYDHSTRIGLRVRFYPDGRAISVNWKGVWKQVSKNTIVVTDQNKNKAVFVFDDKFATYSAVHFDGEKITGARSGDVPAGIR